VLENIERWNHAPWEKVWIWEDMLKAFARALVVYRDFCTRALIFPEVLGQISRDVDDWPA